MTLLTPRKGLRLLTLMTPVHPGTSEQSGHFYHSGHSEHYGHSSHYGHSELSKQSGNNGAHLHPITDAYMFAFSIVDFVSWIILHAQS